MAAPGGLAESVGARADIPAGPLVVALSGGADSAVLAWAAVAASPTVRAVFVDHALEGSAALRAAAGAVAAALDITLDVVDAPVDRDEPSFEDAARTARYRALMDAAKPDETILTGHTADDQAETILGNFLRGAGPAGLSGIPGRRGRIARPLLHVDRAETRALARELALPFTDDPDNEAATVRRNRLRAELIPRLEREYNPALRLALRRTAAVLGADDAALEALAARVPVGGDGEVVTVAAAALAVVPEAVAARAVRRALRTVRGPHAGSLEEVTAVLEVAARRRAGAELTGGLRVEREGALVVFSGEAPAPAAAVPVTAPARVAFDRWLLDFATSDRPPAPRPLGAGVLVADADCSGLELLVRPARDDDRIDIGTGSKPVRDAMSECGIPRRLRLRWPVVEAAGRVAAVPGARLAAWASPTTGTVRYLVARIQTPGAEGPSWRESATYS